LRVDVYGKFPNSGERSNLQLTNPADWLVDLVSISSKNPEEAKKDRQHIENFNFHFLQLQMQKWEESQKQDTKHLIHFQKPVSATPFLTLFIRRLGALFLRLWRQNIRDVTLNAVRLFPILLLQRGEVSKMLGMEKSSYQDALIQLACIALAYLFCCWCCLSLGLNKRGHHRTVTWLLGKCPTIASTMDSTPALRLEPHT
jgi:hypothetical protein